ncbi:hypothetical protein [Kitasatospora sp. NPDC056181]|uniref:hypothetical protein n=1 Tax=Kitasatospora sp. NPDC056181 TaxID=3345737 RepID=UPI0035D69F11
MSTTRSTRTGARTGSGTALVAAAGGSVTPVVLHVAAPCAITALAVLGGRETARGEIAGGI